jgi:hypothetical protein
MVSNKLSLMKKILFVASSVNTGKNHINAAIALARNNQRDCIL